jgi:hypothetical protein
MTMLDFTTYTDAEIIKRGKFSFLGSAKRDELKLLRETCDAFSEVGRRLFRQAQPGKDDIPEDYLDTLAAARRLIDATETSCNRLASLAQQEAELRDEG